MLLYNSATHKKEEFQTHTPGHVEMYTCGPTVYHFAHIGNLRDVYKRQPTPWPASAAWGPPSPPPLWRT